MTDAQLHQEYEKRNRRQEVNRAAAAAQPVAAVPTKPRSFRFVPAAVLCAFIAVGGLVVWKNYFNPDHNELTADSQSSVVDAAKIRSSSDEQAVTVAEEVSAETQEETVDTVTTPEVSTPNVQLAASRPRTVAVSQTASTQTESNVTPVIKNSNGTTTAVLPTTTPLANTSSSRNNIAAPTIVPTAKAQANVAMVAVPTYSIQYVTFPGNSTQFAIFPASAMSYYNNGWNYNVPTTTYTYTYNTYGEYKPATPYLENCGRQDGDRFREVRVVLPKFEKDGKAAVEYHVQIGTEDGRNDVWDHRYEQTDRVVFSIDLDNARTYYVRYRIRMEGGDFQEWSNTFWFRCNRS
ncbi:hypothetical protein IJI99_01175 [bacterium]|nr:hypothetical protein [bacterium]